jgi:RNA polymerase sigma-70 factor (ECF subfamily)
MNPLFARIEHVSESVVEPLSPLITKDSPAGESFEALYRNTFPRVYGYVASLLRDRAAAEDVTAQAYERAYRKQRSYRAARGSREAWLFGIARNAALDELRKRKRRAGLQADLEDVSSPSPPEYAEITLRREAVRAALMTLDPREQDIVALRFAAELSHAEIAKVLRISETSAGTRLHRALEKLRKACDDDA